MWLRSDDVESRYVAGAAAVAGHGSGETWLLSDPCRFETTGGHEALVEAARRLGVSIIGGQANGFHNKSAGSIVARPDGSFCWMRVTGFIGLPPRDTLQAEFDANALTRVAKPILTHRAQWNDNGVFWQAVLMTLAASPAIEPLPWRLPNSRPLPDHWFDALRSALAGLRSAHATRRMLTPGQVQFLIATQFGAEAPAAATEWHVAHGDLHWSNLTAPQLMLLDWERWGIAPRGYTAGRLLAFSLLDPVVTRRLLATFADEIEMPLGRVGMLAAIAEVKIQLDAGIYDGRLKAPLEQLIRRILAADRRTWPLRRRLSHHLQAGRRPTPQIAPAA